MKKYKRLSEGLRYNTDYFYAGKNFKGGEKIDTVIGVLEEFIMELKKWKKEGWDKIDSQDRGEYIPLKN
jgi:hypothetical protein